MTVWKCERSFSTCRYKANIHHVLGLVVGFLRQKVHVVVSDEASLTTTEIYLTTLDGQFREQPLFPALTTHYNTPRTVGRCCSAFGRFTRAHRSPASHGPDPPVNKPRRRHGCCRFTRAHPGYPRCKCRSTTTGRARPQTCESDSPMSAVRIDFQALTSPRQKTSPTSSAPSSTSYRTTRMKTPNRAV